MYRHWHISNGRKERIICYSVVMLSVGQVKKRLNESKYEWQLMFIKVDQTKSCCSNSISTENVPNMHFQWMNFLIFGFTLTMSDGLKHVLCVPYFTVLNWLENYQTLKFTHCGFVPVPCSLAVRHKSCWNENGTEKIAHDYVNLFNFIPVKNAFRFEFIRCSLFIHGKLIVLAGKKRFCLFFYV